MNIYGETKDSISKIIAQFYGRYQSDPSRKKLLLDQLQECIDDYYSYMDLIGGKPLQGKAGNEYEKNKIEFRENSFQEIRDIIDKALSTNAVSNKTVQSVLAAFDKIAKTTDALTRKFGWNPDTYKTLKNIHGFTAHVMIGEPESNQCHTCAELDGNIYLLKHEGGKIPARLHPNCRCFLAPLDLTVGLGDNGGSDIGEFSVDTGIPWYQKLLNDFVDKNEDFITKFSKGNISGGVLNLLGATLNAPKNLYLNALNAASSLIKGEKPRIIYNMDFHDYLEEQKRKFGGDSISDIADSLKNNGIGGDIAGNIIDIASELLTDPLFISAVFKSAGTSIARKSPENAIKYAEKPPVYYQAEGKAEPNVPKAKVDKIIETPKGSRPDPSTYLSKDYMSSHLKEFENGVTKIVANAPTGTAGPPNGTFVMPSSVADDLIAQASGSVSKLEQLLGLPTGSLGANPVRVDIANPTGLRIPSGNELGANIQWIPGGYTSGGLPEAIINSPSVGKYTIKPIK